MKTLKLFFFLAFLFSCGSKEKPELSSTTKSRPVENINYQKVSFKQLTGFKILKRLQPSQFDFNATEETEQEKNDHINKQVPEEIKKLNGIDIEINGYAFPLRLVKGNTSDLVLMSVIPSCCFGDALKINDIIYVNADSNSTLIKENQYINIKGKFNVEMKQTEDRTSHFLYWIKADSMEKTKPGL